MLELPAARIEGATYNFFGVIVPEPSRELWGVLRHKDKFARSGQLYIRASLPKKPRTTGYKSQNHHAWGHAQQIAESVGDYKDDIMAHAKMRAVSHGYPTRKTMFGDIVPISEKEASTVEAGYIIDELHIIASFANVKLKEYE